MSGFLVFETPEGPSAPRRASVPPGTGWPGDIASATTAVAHTSKQVERLARQARDLPELDACVSVCRACPRLVRWREDVAVNRRAAFIDQQYWGRPVTGFGPVDATIAILGLAPAAHGGNRTGRVFTGDPSGDWLFASLHRVGLASQSESMAADDGLQLHRTRILAAVRCAPPQNKPTTQERDRCAPWLHAELQALRPSLRVLVALGAFAWQAAFSSLAAIGMSELPGRRPRFGHGVEATCGPITVVGSYHPSQRNTSTHRLTHQMLDDVLGRAATLGGAGE
ncbi:MAG: uracil-DNA glycosylase [Candidatus Nanopelagicales bacterium]